MTHVNPMSEALRCDRITRDCGPLDPAFEFFARQTDDWLGIAARRESVLVRSIRTQWPHHWGQSGLRNCIRSSVTELRELRNA